VYVFTVSGGAWTQQQELTPSDGEANPEFGSSVSMSGDTAVIGAVNADGGAGAAYLYVRSGELWVQQQELTAPDAADNIEFGVFVSLSGDTAVITTNDLPGPNGPHDRRREFRDN
jgi:acetyl-CoA carboxylase carboxyltransferase component